MSVLQAALVCKLTNRLGLSHLAVSRTEVAEIGRWSSSQCGFEAIYWPAHDHASTESSLSKLGNLSWGWGGRLWRS